jgi:hypothetical protein
MSGAFRTWKMLQSVLAKLLRVVKRAGTLGEDALI